jgi:hypothetical protein
MLCNFVFVKNTLSLSSIHSLSLAVGADARVHVLEALELELWLVFSGGRLLHLDEFNGLLVRLGLLGLGKSLALLSL